MQKLGCCFSHRVCACSRYQNWGTLGLCPSWWGRTWLMTHKHFRPHKCYHSEFGRCGSNRVGAGRSPKILGTWNSSLGMGARLIHRNAPLSTCSGAEFGWLRSNRIWHCVNWAPIAKSIPGKIQFRRCWSLSVIRSRKSEKISSLIHVWCSSSIVISVAKVYIRFIFVSVFVLHPCENFQNNTRVK